MKNATVFRLVCSRFFKNEIFLFHLSSTNIGAVDNNTIFDPWRCYSFSLGFLSILSNVARILPQLTDALCKTVNQTSFRLFGKRCRRCMTLLLPTDIVHRVHYMFYHARCFSCYSCHDIFNLVLQNLNEGKSQSEWIKGDEFHLMDGEVLCRNDYQTIINYGMYSIIIDLEFFIFFRWSSIRNSQENT